MTKDVKKLIYDNFKDQIKYESDVDDIYDALDEMGVLEKEIYTPYFITDELNVFNTKEAAYCWFQSERSDPLDEIKDIQIDNSLVGKTIQEAIIIMILNLRENYLEVNEHIHLTWWL